MKKLIAVMIAVMLMSGCVPHSELDSLAIAEAIGIDFDGSMYTVTMQYFNTDASGGVTAVDSSAPNVITVSANGKSIESALEALSYTAGKNIMLGAVSVIVFGEGALFSLRDSLSFASAHYSGSPRTYIAAAEGKASDIMNVKFTEGNASVDKLESMIKNGEELGLVRPMMLYEVNEKLCEPTRSPVLPMLKAYDDGSDVTEDGKSLILTGGAMCTDGRYAAVLDPDEVSALAILDPAAHSLGNCEIAMMFRGKDTRVMLYRLDAKVTPSYEDGKLSLAISVTAGGKFVSTSISDPYAAREDVEKLCEQEIVRRVESLLSASLTSYGADIFGLEYKIRSYSPEMWQAIKKDYRSVLQAAAFDVNCTVNIERFGIVRSPSEVVVQR